MLALLFITASAASVSCPAATFSNLRTVGSSNHTSFWFPAPIMGISCATADVVVQQVQRAGDGRQGCCHGQCCGKHDCCAATYSTGTLRDSSWRSTASTGQFPPVPDGTKVGWVSDASNFSSLNGFACHNGTCTGQLVRWSTALGSNGLPITKATAYLDLDVHGVPSALISARWSGAQLIMLLDGTLVLPLYGRASDAPTACSQHDGHNSPWCLTAFYFTASQDRPLEWTYRSRIDHVTRMGRGVEGPSENAVAQLPDGRLLTVFRVDSFTEHWAALSSDYGYSWSAPFPTGTWSVSPHLVVLDAGAIVLTGGRPSIGVWVTAVAGNLTTWEFHNVAAQHNILAAATAHHSTYMFPTVDAHVINVSSPDSSSSAHNLDLAASTGYMGLLPTGHDSVLLTYGEKQTL